VVSRFLGRLVLAAALLAAWQSALVHPLEHSDGRGGFVHLSDGHDHERKSDASGLCDALAALTACASDAPQGAFEFELVESIPLHSAAALRAADAPPFRSQGPPALL